MDVLRVPPYPITTIWAAPLANTEYTFLIEDLVDHSTESAVLTSDANKNITYIIPQAKLFFDRKFLVKLIDSDEHIVLEDHLDILRPYVDPSTLGSTASEIAEYSNYEMVARSIIDTIITDGFYNTKTIIQSVGQGTDYFNVWQDVNKVLKVYENNVLVYDVDTPTENVYDFKVTLDNSAIQRVYSDQYNRAEQSPMQLPPAYGDLGSVGGRLLDFPKGYDYIFIVDTGYKAVPPDVEIAAKFLIEDLKCGKLDYYKRYINSYNTDQYKVGFDKRVFEGTGNMIVDKMLDKYLKNIIKPGVI
jgi:hypothetical protein